MQGKGQYTPSIIAEIAGRDRIRRFEVIDHGKAITPLHKKNAGSPKGNSQLSTPLIWG